MKKNLMRKLIAVAMTSIISSTLVIGCGKNNAAGDGSSTENSSKSETVKKDGTIMWLSNLSSGAQYDAVVEYAEMITKELGYKFKVVYGDTFNDPSGNLNAVKNAMTNDVVGIISSQDGGIQNILEEYPDLYVAGYNTDMASVYKENGASSKAATNEKFLGTIADGFISGVDSGKLYAKGVIEKGYKKVSIINFPVYAYPEAAIADVTFREEIASYNKTASDTDKIEIVGDTKTLEFAPLDNSYFLEDQNKDLDAIVGLCAGTDFIYPAMKTAIDAGTINKDMKLITAGFNSDEAVIADVGGDGIIQSIIISPCENVFFAIAMLDNAINGKQYPDYSKSERVEGVSYLIDSKEDIDNVMSKSLVGTLDPKFAQISFEDCKKVLTRYNENATYEDLKALLQSEQVTVEALAK